MFTVNSPIDGHPGEVRWFLPSAVCGLDPRYPPADRFAISFADHLRSRWAQMADEELTEGQREIIRTGRAWLDDRSNVGSGYGFSVHALIARGALKPGRQFFKEGEPRFRVTEYTLTPLGQTEQETLRVSDLARIGVYEVRAA